MNVESWNKTVEEMLADSKWGIPGKGECVCMRRAKTMFKGSNRSRYRPKKNCVHCNVCGEEDGISKEARRTDFVCVTCGVAVHSPPSLCWKDHKFMCRTSNITRHVEIFKGDPSCHLLEQGIFYGDSYQGVEATANNEYAVPDRRLSRIIHSTSTGFPERVDDTECNDTEDEEALPGASSTDEQSQAPISNKRKRGVKASK